MEIYYLAGSLNALPDHGDVWFIELTVPGEAPYRLRFHGTRKAAEAEVDRLNSLARVKVDQLKEPNAF